MDDSSDVPIVVVSHVVHRVYDEVIHRRGVDVVDVVVVVVVVVVADHHDDVRRVP